MICDLRTAQFTIRRRKKIESYGGDVLGIDASLYPMIEKRKSFHLFRNIGDERITPEEIDDIYRAYAHFAPLCPEIKTAIKIVPAQETTCKRGQEYCLLLYSEQKENYLQNVGYLGEQLDLYLTEKNIGTLWYGMGKTEEAVYHGLDFVIMIAISKVDDAHKFRKAMRVSKRKPKAEIWVGDEIPGVTDVVRFAPSSCNTQPWIVEHQNGALAVYRYRRQGKRGIMPPDRVNFYNQIDMGIFLCFLELCLAHEGIDFARECFVDAGTTQEKTLVATYRLQG